MAHISQHGEYRRAEIRRRGYKPVYRTFDTKRQAQKWARHIEGEMDARSLVDRSEAERTTLADALKRSRKEIVPEKRHPYQEERRIDRWLDNNLAYRTLATLRGVDFAKYRDARRATGDALEKRVLPAFDGIDEEASALQEKTWNELISMPFNPDVDESMLAEAAFEVGYAHYSGIQSFRRKTRVYRPMPGKGLYLTMDNLREYGRATIDFWNEFVDALERVSQQ